MPKRFTITPAAFLIIEKDGQVLLLRRTNTRYQDGNFGLPSGHLEHGELPTVAAIREGEEEVGVRVSRSEFVTAVYNSIGSLEGAHYINFFFKALEWDGEPVICEPDKCSQMEWFPISNLPPNLTPEVREALMNSQRGIPYSEI